MSLTVCSVADWPAWPQCWHAACFRASRWPWATSGMTIPAGGTGLTQTWCRLWRAWAHATTSESHIYPFVSVQIMLLMLFSTLSQALSLTSCLTRPTWMRRTKWSAPPPSCGRPNITITIFLTALEIWSNMWCACQPSKVTSVSEDRK